MRTGGGIRDDETIRSLIDEMGLVRLVIGTKALREPEWFRHMAQRFHGKLVLGIDARDGLVATDGWLQTSSTPAIDLRGNSNDYRWPQLFTPIFPATACLVARTWRHCRRCDTRCDLPVGGLAASPRGRRDSLGGNSCCRLHHRPGLVRGKTQTRRRLSGKSNHFRRRQNLID